MLKLISFLTFLRINIHVDTELLLRRDLPPDVPTPLPLANFYIAGIPSSFGIPVNVPIVASFNGDIKHVKINGDTLFDGR